MPGICIERPEDLPYGPGQTDYEYDAWRQRQLEEEEQLLQEEHDELHD